MKAVSNGSSNGNSSGNGMSMSAGLRNGTLAPQSWSDLPLMPTSDPRRVIQSIALQDNAGTMQTAKFARLNSWLAGGPWVASIINISVTPGNLTVPNVYDYASQEIANEWNSLRQMTSQNPLGMPSTVNRLMFLKAGASFVNNLYLDFTPAKTSQDILISMRDNSYTSGDFENAAGGTFPVFQLPSGATYGNTGRNLQVTVLKAGWYDVCMRVLDNAGNCSMYEMEWIVMP